MQITKNKRENVYENAVLYSSGFFKMLKILTCEGFSDESTVVGGTFCCRRWLYLLNDKEMWKMIVAMMPVIVTKIAMFC